MKKRRMILALLALGSSQLSYSMNNNLVEKDQVETGMVCGVGKDEVAASQSMASELSKPTILLRTSYSAVSGWKTLGKYLMAPYTTLSSVTIGTSEGPVGFRKKTACMLVQGGPLIDPTLRVNFETVFIDRSINLAWSSAISGTYSNGCTNEADYYSKSKCSVTKTAEAAVQVSVDDSAAARACRNFGARLPTRQEYESLMKNFDLLPSRYLSTSPFLSEKGVRDMQSVFKDTDNLFWTSSINSEDDFNNAFVFEVTREAGHAVRFQGRSHRFAVRCVR